jgi:membrane protease YdiL (CAAX protease family)
VGITRLVLVAAGVPAADYSMFRPLVGNPALYLFWVGPVSWGTAAFGEEMLMRGFVLDGFRRLLGGEGARLAAPGAVALQALLFGLLHAYQGLGGVVLTAVIGLAFGIIWLGSGRNLWAGIVIHGLIDSVSLTVLFLGLGPA